MLPALRAIPLLAVLLLASCMPQRGGGRWEPGQETEDQRTTLRVENRSWSEVTVYAVRGTQRIRLGNVPGVTTRVLTIPDNLVQGMGILRFLADPLGSSRAPVSHEITVQPGDQIEMYVPPS